MLKRGRGSGGDAAAASSSSASATSSTSAFEQRLRGLPAELWGRVLAYLSYKDGQLNGLGLVSRGLREATLSAMPRVLWRCRDQGLMDAVRLFPQVKELVLRVGTPPDPHTHRPQALLSLPALAGFTRLQKLALVLEGEFHFEAQAGEVKLPHLQTLEVMCVGDPDAGSAEELWTTLGAMHLPELKEVELLGYRWALPMHLLSPFFDKGHREDQQPQQQRGNPTLETLGVRLDVDAFLELLGSSVFKSLRRLFVVCMGRNRYRDLVEGVARGGLQSPLFRLEEVRIMVARIHFSAVNKHSPEMLDFWGLDLLAHEEEAMTAEKWDGIIARRQAALLLEGFGPGDARVTHALLDLLDEPCRTLPTTAVLDALGTMMREAPTPALVGAVARAPLVAEHALRALQKGIAEKAHKKGDPALVLALLSSLCSLRRRGRQAWPAGEQSFPAALAFASLRAGILAKLLALLSHQDRQEGRGDVGTSALLLLRALPLEGFSAHLRQTEDDGDRQAAMAGVTLPLLLRLADAACLRHPAGDMRRLWNLGVLAQVLAMAEPEAVQRVWGARSRALAFAMLASLSVGYHQAWVACSQDGRLQHPVVSLYQRLKAVVPHFPALLCDMVLEGRVLGIPSSAPSSVESESGKLMGSRGVLLARFVVALSEFNDGLPKDGTLPPRLLTPEMLWEHFGVDVRDGSPFSLHKMELSLGLRTILQSGDDAKAALLSALPANDLLALLLTLPVGENATEAYQVLLDGLYGGDLERMLAAMLECAKSGDAAFLATHPTPAPAAQQAQEEGQGKQGRGGRKEKSKGKKKEKEAKAKGKCVGPTAGPQRHGSGNGWREWEPDDTPLPPSLETAPLRAIVARALFLFLKHVPPERTRLFMALDDQAWREKKKGKGKGKKRKGKKGGKGKQKEEEEEQEGDGGGGAVLHPGVSLLRDVLVPLVVAKAPQGWVAHAVLGTLEDCFCDPCCMGLDSLRRNCGPMLAKAALRIAACREGDGVDDFDVGIPLLRKLYRGVSVSERRAVVKALEAEGKAEGMDEEDWTAGMLEVKWELDLPTGEKGKGKRRRRPRLESEEEEEEEEDWDGYFPVGSDGEEEDEGGGEQGGELMAPAVAFAAAQEEEDEGSLEVDEIMEEWDESDVGSGEEDDDDDDDGWGSEGSGEGDMEEAWNEFFGNGEEDEDDDEAFMLGEEEEEFDEAPLADPGMYYGGEEEDVNGEDGGRGSVDAPPTEMELWM